MTRTTNNDPWTMRGMLAHLYPRRQRSSPAMVRQDLARQLVTRQLTEMSLSRFEWLGLPDSVNPSWLEQLLLRDGQAVIARDKNNGAIIPLSVAPIGPGNYQNEYASVRGIAPTWGSDTFTVKRRHLIVNSSPVVVEPDAVHVFNNATRSSDVALIEYYADRLTELDTTIDINSMNMRRNKVVVADENTKLAVENILSEVAHGEPVIRVRNSMEGVITTLDLSVHPESVDRLHIFRGRLFNEAMMSLGIDNTNQDKKERMITDEIGGNDDQVARIRSSMLNARRRAAEQISSVFGLDVSVDYSTIDDPSNDTIGAYGGVL